ncbi:MAG: permease [Pseudomonadota bacterium]|nr:permease [Pseudomonadota bacterium]
MTIIAAAAFTSTLAGGLLALRLRDQLHLILGFSAGAVIGVAFFDLLPEALAGAATRPPATLLACTATGFLGYLVLDRILAFHPDASRRSGVTASVLCLHSLIDGIAIGLAFQTSHAIGVIVAVGVLTHDFSDGINTMNIVLRKSDAHGTPRAGPPRAAIRWLLADAAAPVAGIGLTGLFRLPAADFGVALAVFAGFFLYIGASDLIPESYHAHPKFLTTAMTLVGAAVLYFAIRLIG